MGAPPATEAGMHPLREVPACRSGRASLPNPALPLCVGERARSDRPCRPAGRDESGRNLHRDGVMPAECCSCSKVGSRSRTATTAAGVRTAGARRAPKCSKTAGSMRRSLLSIVRPALRSRPTNPHDVSENVVLAQGLLRTLLEAPRVGRSPVQAARSNIEPPFRGIARCSRSRR